MAQVSERGKVLPASPIRKLTPLADAAKRKGIHVHHLNIGQPDLPTPEIALEALKNIDRKTLEYSPSEGLLSLRKKMVEYYGSIGVSLDPSEIIITSGGSEALMFGFMACMNPGDEMIITEPAYANYHSFAQMAGIKVVPLISKIDNGFALPDIAEFEKLITPRTKAILICNPNNPTGYTYTKEELLKIRDLVKKYDLFLFSDEVYREFFYSAEPLVSALTLEGIEQNVILCDSFSKRYSECGIRVGAFISRNKEVCATVLKYCQARLSPPLLGQIVAEASIDAPKSYLENMYQEYISRRNLLVEGLNKIEGVYTPMPNGAFYTIAQLPIDDADKFCAWMLSDFSYEGQTVMMAPATGFYSDNNNGKNQVRIAYVLELNELKKALVVLEKGLEKYNSLNK
ncbi:aspartate aminotransferase [Porphyromonadaceae bacterium COT-184 OH4590]|nr:aspartate aminotransferase [Porphyromonadaceae bacterium COT-184 OH4590]MDO4726955.1 pyridoxal phosphate-dependent aminotransferase [Porphyromonadaceae bacterium]